MADMEKFIPGRYVAKQDDDYNWMNRYQITIDLKETEKSIIIEKVEMIGRYLPAQIEMLFQNGDKVVINKRNSRHAICRWSNHDFTIYPFQAGIPFYFKLINDIK